MQGNTMSARLPIEFSFDGPNKRLPSCAHYREFTLNELNIQRQQQLQQQQQKIGKIK